MKNNEINLDENLFEDDNQNVEPERLTIEKIEELKDLSNHYENQTIFDALAAGANGLASLICLSKALTFNLSSIEQIPIYVFGLLAIGYIGLGVNSHKHQKSINAEINKINNKSK